MSKPDAPTPPNPVATAAASTSTNVGTAVANAFLNNTNQITPEGELRYDPTGSYTWNDPYTGLAVNIPTFTATQLRSDQQQAIQNQINGCAVQYGRHGQSAVRRGRAAPSAAVQHRRRAVGRRYSADWPPAGEPQRSIGYQGPGQQFTFGDAGQITRDYGPADNYSQDRLRVEESLYGRLNPQLDRERGNIEQRLADQGIRYGSAALIRRRWMTTTGRRTTRGLPSPRWADRSSKD